MKHISNIYSVIKQGWFFLSVSTYLLFTQSAYAVTDKIKLPTNVEVEGVNEDSNILEIIVSYVIVFVKIAIWIAVLVAGVVLLINIIKSVSAVMENKRDGGSAKWGAIIGDILGSAGMFMLVLLVAVLIQTYL